MITKKRTVKGAPKMKKSEQRTVIKPPKPPGVPSEIPPKPPKKPKTPKMPPSA
ncbi:MAG: hypothetical protein AB1553_11145 [Nitrospirota bacterium]